MIGFVAIMLATGLMPQAFADTLAQSNVVTVTGGYMQSITVPTWEQTGTTTEAVQVQTGGGYYQSYTYQSGTQQVCTTTQVATNHATFYPGYWVDTGYWDNSAKRWVDSGYWSPGYYSAPYFNTYQDVMTCNTQPVYSTGQSWVPPTYGTSYETVPTYGYVNETQQQWVPTNVQS